MRDARIDELKILALHPWINRQRGGERAFYSLARALPQADLAVLFAREIPPPDIASRICQTSFLHRNPFSRLPYRLVAPLLPLAVSRIDTSAYELVVSSSSGWTHGVRTQDPTRHLCYMYTPARYLWSDVDLPSDARAMGHAIRLASVPLRNWDFRAARRVHSFAAISRYVQQRIRDVYGRDSELIYPAVEIARLKTAVPQDRRSYALTVAELVPYKRVDVAILAARSAGVPLTVVGDGPERTALERLAADADVKFVGRVSGPRLIELYAGARVFVYPALEDFGIVTVEALGSGCPVVGYGRGGTAEIVSADTGILLDAQDPEQFASALLDAWHRSWDVAAMTERAALFDVARFRREFRSWVERNAHPIGANGVGP